MAFTQITISNIQSNTVVEYDDYSTFTTSIETESDAAFNKANSANILAQAAFTAANTANVNAINVSDLLVSLSNQVNSISATNDSQNTRMTIIEGVNTTQNTNITAVDAKAQAAYNQANTGGGGGGGTLDQFARDTANSASSYANGAFAAANTSITTSGGSITGSLNVSQNLTVTGNLTILGTTTTINTSSFTVSDSLITLGVGNYTSDLLDIGISGHYNDGTNAHTGLIRDHGTKDWYLFKGYTPELSGNNNIDINHASFAKANINADYFKGNVIATTITGSLTLINTITGNVSIATNSSAANSIGYLGVPQSNLNPMSSNYTLVIGDSGEHLYMVPGANSYNVFIPANSSVPFPIGTAIVTVLDAAFTSNVVPTTGVTLRMAGNTSGANIARTMGYYSMASLLKVGTDTWYISGSGVT